MNFLWSLFPGKQSTKTLEKSGENSEENSEENSGENQGRKFEKFGELSFCNFSDLKVLAPCFKSLVGWI